MQRKFRKRIKYQANNHRAIFQLGNIFIRK